MKTEIYDENNLVLAAEDFSFESFDEYHFFTSHDKRNISKLRAHGPVLLKGARGAGKSALMIEAYKGMYPIVRNATAIGIYISLRNLDLLRSTGDEYIRLLCNLVTREVNRILSEHVVSPSTNNIIDLQNQLNEISIKNNKRIVLFFDDAAHVGRETNLNDFFDMFRTLSNSYISCKASIYPGVTRFGTRFDVYNDATIIEVNRPEKSNEFSQLFEEVVNRRFSSELSSAKFSGGLTKNIFCDLVGQAVLGNMRAFIFACIEIINRSGSSSSIHMSHISESFKQLSSNFFWPLLEEIKPKLGMYEPMVAPAEDIASIVFTKAGSRGERSVIILRDICQELKKPLEILEYTGFIARKEVSRAMKSRGRGTRYILNLCILTESMNNGRINIDDFNKWSSVIDEGSVEFHRGSELATVKIPEIDENQNIDILGKNIDALRKSNAYPYGLTDRMIEILKQSNINTIEDLFSQTEENIDKIKNFGSKTTKRIFNTLNQAIWM